jgi:hypothetical protein
VEAVRLHRRCELRAEEKALEQVEPIILVPRRLILLEGTRTLAGEIAEPTSVVTAVTSA